MTARELVAIRRAMDALRGLRAPTGSCAACDGEPLTDSEMGLCDVHVLELHVIPREQHLLEISPAVQPQSYIAVRDDKAIKVLRTDLGTSILTVAPVHGVTVIALGLDVTRRVMEANDRRGESHFREAR